MGVFFSPNSQRAQRQIAVVAHFFGECKSHMLALYIDAHAICSRAIIGTATVYTIRCLLKFWPCDICTHQHTSGNFDRLINTRKKKNSIYSRKTFDFVIAALPFPSASNYPSHKPPRERIK